MLVLSRQRDETIMIGDEVEVTIVDIRGDKVRLGITAPKEITVHRKEVYEAIKRENRAAAQVRPEDLSHAGISPRQPGPRLAGGAAGAGPAGEAGKFDPDKPVVRPTIRASMPQAIRPHKPERNDPRRPQSSQHPPQHHGGGPAASTPPDSPDAPPAKDDHATPPDESSSSEPSK